MIAEETVYDLEITRGNRCVWMDVGVDVSNETSVRGVLETANLDWTVSKLPMFAERKGKTEIKQVPVPGRVGVIRNDIDICLSDVNDSADIIQNCEGFNLLDFIQDSGWAKFYRAGALHMGLRPWVIMKGRDSVVAANTRYDSYLIVFLTHDKDKYYTAQHVLRRVGAETTFPLCVPEQVSFYKVKKIGSDRKEDAQNVVAMMRNSMATLGSVLHKLDKVPLPPEEATQLINKLITGSSAKVATRTHNIRRAIYAAYRTGEGNKGKTCLDLINGIAEFVDHSRPTRVEEQKSEADLRFESVIIGSGAALKQKCLDMLMKKLK